MMERAMVKFNSYFTQAHQGASFSFAKNVGLLSAIIMIIALFLLSVLNIFKAL